MNLSIYLVCICLIFIIGRLLIFPLKKILKLITNSILGGVAILLINVIGKIWGFHIGINIITSIVVGLLGLPGAVCLIVIKLLVG